MTWIEHLLGILALLACGGYIVGILAVLVVIGGAVLDDNFTGRR